MTDAEITRLVAEKVMEWEQRTIDPLFGGTPEPHWVTHNDATKESAFQSLMWIHRRIDYFDPLNDDCDACAVLDKMEPVDRMLATGNYEITGDARRRQWIRAALRAKGVEVE